MGNDDDNDDDDLLDGIDPADVFGSPSPFDPERGIAFKTGLVAVSGRNHLAEYEAAVGVDLPADFAEMIGDHYEGSFDGDYRVWARDGVEIRWDHMMLLGIAPPEVARWVSPEHDALRVLGERRALFYGRSGSVELLPFGTAHRMAGLKEFTKGWLAFDVAGGNAVVFVTGDGRRTPIATSFREMMSRADFMFYG
jgi:hypothetical protein